MAYKSLDGMDHATAEEAHAHNYESKARENSGSSAGGAAGGGGGGIIVLILLAIPAIVAKVLGTIFAFFSKLGIIGKILQTVIVGVVGIIITLFVTGLFPGDIFAVLALPVAIMVCLWFWLYHHDEIKNITVKEYSNNIATSFAIVLYGFVVSIFVGSLVANLFGDTVGSIFFLAVLIVLFGWAILSYLSKTSSYREEIAKTRKNPKGKKLIITIAAIYLGISIISGFIGIAFPGIRKSINIDLTGRSADEKFSKDATIFAAIQEANLYDEPSENAGIIRTIEKGQRMEVMWDMEFKDKLMPVRIGNDKGWVNVDYIE